MKVFKESLNLFLICIIMVGMMIFFHALGGLDLWLTFFIVVFYGFLGFKWIYHKKNKPIILFIPSMIILMVMMIYMGLFIYTTQERLGIIGFILMQFLIYVILLGRSVIISEKYQSYHDNRISGLSLSFFCMILFLEWTKYDQFKDKLILALLIILTTVLFIYILNVLFKSYQFQNLKWLFCGIHLLMLVIYRLTHPTQVLYFLMILSHLTIIICLFTSNQMFGEIRNHKLE